MRNNKEEFLKSKNRIDMSNLKNLRERNGYSQIKLQHLVGVSDSAIQGYEQGKRIPSLPVAYRLADVFNVSIDYLCGRNDKLNKFYSLSPQDQEEVLKLIEKLSSKN